MLPSDSHDQKYISKTLYHFVGRSAGSDIEAFKTLMKILSEETLLFDPGNKSPRATAMFSENAFHKLGEISNIPAVCFCDIPAKDLALHMSKYSKFGVGFKKEKLCAMGVRPVWYIPKDSYSAIATNEKIGNRLPAELLRTLISTSTIITKLTEGKDDLVASFNILSKDAEVQKCLENLLRAHFFLLGEIAWFFKFYDSSLPDDHLENYYFEREWRKVNGNLSFKSSDIDCIAVPEETFRNELISKFPQYNDIVEIR